MSQSHIPFEGELLFNNNEHENAYFPLHVKSVLSPCQVHVKVGQSKYT